MSNNNNNNVIILSFIVAFCWSIVPIISKTILNDIPATSLFLMFYLTVSFIVILYTIYNWHNIKLPIEKINTKIVIKILIIVLIGNLIADYLYYHVLEKNETYLVTIITSVAPIFTILLAYFYLNEKINLIKWIGIIFTIFGITLASL